MMHTSSNYILTYNVQPLKQLVLKFIEFHAILDTQLVSGAQAYDMVYWSYEIYVECHKLYNT